MSKLEPNKLLSMYQGLFISNQADSIGQYTIGHRGTFEGGKLKKAGTRHWKSPNLGATNKSGFTAIPNGHRYVNGGFNPLDVFANFWSSTETEFTDYLWSRNLYFGESDITRDTEPQGVGIAVRCVKN